jgi:WD40 repeat protein
VSEERVRELLREHPVPEQSEAEERAWRVVSAAFEERPAVRPSPSRRRRSRLAVAIAAILALGVVALTPAGAAVGDWISDTFDPGRDDARPALASLPAEGRLLVTSAQGPWVVHGDGSKRRLGAYEDAGWSPGGLFVVVTRGRELVAVEPDGDPRWSLARRAPVSRPAWSPDGFRIAYLSGASLRVVAGDGTGDGRLVRRVAPVAPSWSPAAEHVLAYADRQGRITAVQTDSGRRLWRSAPGPVPEALAWTPDGGRVLAIAGGSLRMLDDGGELLIAKLPTDGFSEALAIHPSGRSVALLRHDRVTRRSEVVSLPIAGGARPRRLFEGDGRFSDLAWSPDGRWLLIGWPDADQWIFTRASGRPKVVAVSNISSQFDPAGKGAGAFPGVSGWCCSAPDR